MRHPAILAAVLLMAGTGHSHAVTLTPDDLPTALQGCTGHPCGIDFVSIVDTGYMSVYNIYRSQPDFSIEINWLVRYQLASPSARTIIGDLDEAMDGEPYDGTIVTTPYTGHLWLEAPTTLALSGQNLFRLYTDHIVPDPSPSDPDNPSTWEFGMGAETAIGGSAYRHIAASGDTTGHGSLELLVWLLVCTDCGIDIQLNLIGLHYGADGTGSINPADDRSIVLQYEDFWGYYSNTSAFHVQAVPLPAAVWLFGFGLATLVLLARSGCTRVG